MYWISHRWLCRRIAELSSHAGHEAERSGQVAILVLVVFIVVVFLLFLLLVFLLLPGLSLGGAAAARLSFRLLLSFVRSFPFCIVLGDIDHNKRTYKKENLIFIIYKEIQNGAVAKSYMINGLLM